MTTNPPRRGRAAGLPRSLAPRLRLPLPSMAILTLLVLSAGCGTPGPALTKSQRGNCQIEVIVPDGYDVRRAEIWVDDVFIGNATEHLPVLDLRNGERRIRAELEGCRPWSKSMTILGHPNHQVLNIFFEKETPE